MLEPAYKRSKNDGISLEKKATYTATGDSGQQYNIIVQYDVEIRKNKLFTQARVDFDVKGNKGEVQDTNLREQYKLVSTVVLAFLNFANQVESLAPLTRAVIYAKSDSGQGLSIDSKRARLYLQYIEKNLDKLPGKWEITPSEDKEGYVLIRKK
jgi:hypothetical protein